MLFPLPHSFSSFNTSHSGKVLHAPLWQHQTKHKEAMMVMTLYR